MGAQAQNVWLGPATKRHAPHVVAAAAAIVAAYHLMNDPDLLYLGALSVAVSGVVAGAIEAGRWAYGEATDTHSD